MSVIVVSKIVCLVIGRSPEGVDGLSLFALCINFAALNSIIVGIYRVNCAN